ncbi:hypothetical protein FBY40_2555 [Microbacterium sp. SLBN-154]|nr:hypothetical protein FBY40_2555 [Microbacterium sp. SLBN-154]
MFSSQALACHLGLGGLGLGLGRLERERVRKTSLHTPVDHGSAPPLAQPGSLAEVQWESLPATGDSMGGTAIPTEDTMEYGFLSHVLVWVVGAITAVGAVGLVLAVFSMARTAYRKD